MDNKEINDKAVKLVISALLGGNFSNSELLAVADDLTSRQYLGKLIGRSIKNIISQLESNKSLNKTKININDNYSNDYVRYALNIISKKRLSKLYVINAVNECFNAYRYLPDIDLATTKAIVTAAIEKGSEGEILSFIEKLESKVQKHHDAFLEGIMNKDNR